MMLELAAGDYRLVLDPALGGSIARFGWRGEALLRPTCGSLKAGRTPLDTACFPLVPFSNRIAGGRFEADGRVVRLAPNMPGGREPHPLHGFGWLSAWSVAESDAATALLVHEYRPGEWPWAYRAEQHVALDDEGLTLALSVTNHGATPMPAGLGFHPYVPRDDATRYLGLHRGEWHNTPNCLPDRLDLRDEAIDWWHGRPLAERDVDTAYVGREGPLTVITRGIALTFDPSPELGVTVVYVPHGPGDAYACIEPVSHATDAINRRDEETGLRWLAPGDTMRASLRMSARSVG